MVDNNIKAMVENNAKFRVYNRTNYDIGVTLSSGQKPNIRKGSFLPLSVDDILYIESIARGRKPFSSKELVPVDPSGKDLSLEDLGGYTDEYAEQHFSEEEIKTNLKKPFKAVENWLNKIEDPVELHAIAEVAVKMDLPGSKLKLVQAKMPNVDLLDNIEQ